MSSTRTADYAIQGFLYQFNKTLLEILTASGNATITVEGPIEDIEVLANGQINAIQCKYHEGKAQFILSAIYKPLLQMMEHFQNNPGLLLRYRLYAYFPNEAPGDRPVTRQDLQGALDSKSEGLQRYIHPLKGKIDLTAFLAKLTMEFGGSLQSVSGQVREALEDCGFDKDEVPILIYPNAVHLLSQYSIAHDVVKRRVTKREFIAALKALRTTAITKWTLKLRNARELLAARRAQLKQNLGKNNRSRVFILGPSVENMTNEIVPFIQEYLEKYHFKICHTATPLFCIDCPEAEVNDICNRLYQKGIRASTGQVGGKFEREEILRDPLVKYKKGVGVEREAHLRLISCERIDDLFPDYPCDDLLVAGTNVRPKNPPKDAVVEVMSVTGFQNLKYVLGMTNARQ